MIYSMTLDPIANIHPARIAAANGARNPYRVTNGNMRNRTPLLQALCHAWARDAAGWTQPNKMLIEAAELTRIQLATR